MARNSFLIIPLIFNGIFSFAQETPLLVVPAGHGAPISSVAVSADGRWIFTSSIDGTAILWNDRARQIATVEDYSVEKKGALARFNPDNAPSFGITAVALSPDGRLMITGSQSGAICLWSEEGKLVKKITEHTKAVRTIAFSLDGSAFATGYEDGRIILWSLEGEAAWKINKAHSDVTALAFSPDGFMVYSGGFDRKIKVWERPTGKPLRTFSTHKSQGRHRHRNARRKNPRGAGQAGIHPQCVSK